MRLNNNFEFNENNNVYRAITYIRKDLPDLSLSSSSVPVGVTTGIPFTAAHTIYNWGTSPSEDFELAYFLSDDGVLDPAEDEELATYNLAAIDASDNFSAIHNITIPTSYDHGIYHLFVVANPDSTFEERSYYNNRTSFKLCVHPDLAFTGDDPEREIAQTHRHEETRRQDIRPPVFKKGSDTEPLPFLQQVINAQMKLFPNPTRDRAHLQLDNLPEDTPLLVTIRDLNGKTLHTITDRHGSGTWQQSLDLSLLPAGSYVVEALFGREQLSSMIVVE